MLIEQLDDAEGVCLAFPVAAGGYHDGSDKPTVATASRPCLEDDERLYFFDKGFLTALDRSSGKTLWRLPSFGSQKVQLDDSVLYVNSANGSAESLQYSQQADLTSVPMLLKVEAASGKVLWKKEKYEDCFVSQGSIYAVREHAIRTTSWTECSRAATRDLPAASSSTSSARDRETHNGSGSSRAVRCESNRTRRRSAFCSTTSYRW